MSILVIMKSSLPSEKKTDKYDNRSRQPKWLCS